ncbi:Ran GTPase-activating protein 1 [Ceratocystis fimbriata CBS 114723]|uniref:Ran GTPase-activating protein 1 n=1 Tax=Ceratocystis fimbriata CBS 114723 TaxID=1035309 RepID=A0A2C5WTM6_9PEZI|nr:Ran GTPase-activating protein 1 [Ceratocystis fimbriata CBS 114723]
MSASTKVFSLEGKGLKLDSAADIEPHIAPLRDMTDVEEVRLLGNTFGIEACKALGEVLATKKSLKSANFADIFTGRLLSEIPDALSHLLTSVVNLPLLNTVDLSDNAFGISTHAPLVVFLADHVPLQHLYLNNNGLGPQCGTLVANALSKLHAKKAAARKAGQTVPDLETVVCGRNRLENGSMVAWANAYTLHNRVRHVKMVQNGIRPSGLTHIFTYGLNRCKQLRVLDLQDNSFALVGVNALVKAISAWSYIEDLTLNDGFLKATGSELVAKALAASAHKNLHTLRLQYNDLNAKGLATLLEAVKALPALRKLEINGNRFSEEDACIEALTELFDERKEAYDGPALGDEHWGLDDLDELDDDSDEEEDDDEEEKYDPLVTEEEAAKLISEAELAQEEEPVAGEQDKEVDELATKLSKTAL